MQTPDPTKTPQAISSALVSAIGHIFPEACSLAWKVGIVAESAEPAPEPSAATAFQLRFSGSWSGEATLVFRSSEIGTLSLKATEPKSSAASDTETLGRVMQALGAAMSKLLEEHGPMNIHAESGLAPDKAANPPLELSLSVDAGEAKLSIYVYCDSNLIASAQATSSKSFTFPEATEAANLDLVLDVALNVTLRFGQRQLALREVLDLTSGSVVELDRQVDEPVELVLDGRVIARGEAVIIDGSYGMRITQVVQPVLP